MRLTVESFADQVLLEIRDLRGRSVDHECSALGRKITFEDFAEFIGAARPECLGTTVEKLKMRCTYNQYAVDMIERELSGKDA